MNLKQLGAVWAASLFLGGCMLGPNYKQPELDLPAGQSSDNFSVFTNAKWWEVFQDPVLDQLESEALEYNKDLQAAVARVDQARAAVGIAAADQLPSLSAAAESGRAGSQAGSGETQSTANVSVSYELDLWGKYRRLSEAARAQLLASEAARDTIRLTLTADVAKNYFSLRMLDAQLEIAQRTLKARQENVRIYTSRYQNGYCTEVDLKRVEANMASVQAQEQQLRLKIAQTETALSVLVGKSPREMVQNELASWFGDYYDKIIVAANYNLILNAADMVKNGVGIALCFYIENISDDLCFVPFSPTLETGAVLAWKKNYVFSSAATEFIRWIRDSSL